MWREARGWGWVRDRRVWIGVALLVGIALRIWLLSYSTFNYDIDSYRIVVEILERGGNVYAETTRYNYSPFWFLILGGLAQLGNIFGLGLPFVVRAFLIGVDVGVALLIGLVAREVRKGSGAAAAVCYWLNPVAILIVGYHGQFDNLAALPLLVGLWLSLQAQTRGKTFLVWLAGAAAFVVKQTSWFGVWTLFYCVFRLPRAVIALLVCAVLFLVLFLPYLPEGARGIAENVLIYDGATRVYGFGLLFPPAIGAVIFIGVMGLLPSFSKLYLALHPVDAMELTFVAMLTFIFGIGEQYFILPIIFGSVRRSRGYWLFTVVAGFFLLTSTRNIHLLALPNLWNSVWLAALVWFLSFVVTWKRAPEGWRESSKGFRFGR